MAGAPPGGPAHAEVRLDVASKSVWPQVFPPPAAAAAAAAVAAAVAVCQVDASVVTKKNEEEEEDEKKSASRQGCGSVKEGDRAPERKRQWCVKCRVWGHSYGVHRCTICKSWAHETKDCLCVCGKRGCRPSEHWCRFCYGAVSKTHDTEHHVCFICFKTGHHHGSHKRSVASKIGRVRADDRRGSHSSSPPSAPLASAAAGDAFSMEQTGSVAPACLTTALSEEQREKSDVPKQRWYCCICHTSDSREHCHQ